MYIYLFAGPCICAYLHVYVHNCMAAGLYTALPFSKYYSGEPICTALPFHAENNADSSR
jgi:hypothetical protein